MKNKPSRNLAIWILMAVSFLFVSCTREAQKSTSHVTIRFPSSTQSSLTSLETGSKVTSEKPNFDYTVVPADYSQIDCLLVFVGGPEDLMRGNYCEKSADKSQHFKFGVFVGAVSKEQSVTFEVPSGSSRYIRLYGMKKPTEASLCPAIVAGGEDSLLSGFSTPYFLGESKPTEMIPGTTISVEIPVVAAIDSSAYFDDCKGPSFGSGTGSGGGSTDSSKPYLRIEGLHNFNKIENPSFARPMARGACYPFTFKTFKPCNGGQCEAYTLQNALTITTGSNLKFFTLETDCQSDTNAVLNFTMSAGQSQIPASGSFYMRAPLGQMGPLNTNLGGDISISSTNEVNFNQPSFTNIDIIKPKIIASNLPGSVSYGSCASGTNTAITAYEDSAGTIPMNSHQVFPFEGVFLMAKTLTCGAQVFAIPSNSATLTVNLAKPSAFVSGISGSNIDTVVFDPNSNKYYIGGFFSSYGGKIAGNIIRLNPDGSYDPSFDSGLGFDGEVYSIVPDGTGGVYVAGDFTNYKSIAVKKLARIDSTGKLDLNFGFNFNGAVYAIKLAGSNLYIGGVFTQINGVTRNYIASIDISTKTLTSWDPNASNMVKALELNGSTIYAGGMFSTIGGQIRNRIAAIDSTTGLSQAWNPNANGIVNAIDISGAAVYVGGAFTTIAGSGRNRLAALDITTGSATAWNPNITGTMIYTVKSNGSNVVFGGVFTQVGGSPANQVAAVDNSSGSLAPGELNPYWGTLIFNSLFYDFIPFNISQ